MEDPKRRQFAALVKELAAIRGRHTELVTVYVPADFQLNKVAEQLRSEQSTAENIKSKSTRKNVVSALEKILQHLKLYKETPPHGLAIFAGNVSDKEGADDMELWAIEPPDPVHIRLYRCDQTFILDPLLDMVREREVYGLILIDKGDAAIGLLTGKRVEILKEMDSLVPGKTTAGGWSQHRYERLREEALHAHLKKVGEIATAKFREQKDLIGILIGGPGQVKEDFEKGEFLDYQLQKKILGLVNTAYTGEIGLKEMVERAEDIMKEASATRERELLDRFLTELAKDSGLAVYGYAQVIQALDAGAVDLLLISENFDWVEAKLQCQQCKHELQKTINRQLLSQQKCPKCANAMSVLTEKEATEALIEKAGQMGTKVELISGESAKGDQLAQLGGVGGLLRYRLR